MLALRDLPAGQAMSPNRRMRAVGLSAVASSSPTTQLPPIMRIPPDELAKGGLGILRDGPEAAAGFAAHLADNFLPVDVTAFTQMRVLNVDPPVLSIDDFLTAEECDALTTCARESGRMEQSGVGDLKGAAGKFKTHARTSTSLAISSEVMKSIPGLQTALDAVLSKAKKLLPASSTSSTSKFVRPNGPGDVVFELPQVACYMKGQYFKSHEDAFPSGVALKKGFQRRSTLLIYLNDVSQGGGTKFDHLGVEVRPKKGRALLFFPSFAGGMPDSRTLHTATDAEDEKWVSQLWISVGLQPPKQATGGDLKSTIKSQFKRIDAIKKNARKNK